MRRRGFGSAVLLLTLVLSHPAAGDLDLSGADVPGDANAAVDNAALAVPRFSPTWIGAGENPFRMVAADLNRDGTADLAVVDRSSATVSVRFGNGAGQFGRRTAYRTGRSPLGLVASDLDGDGNLDLASASTGATESITVLINRGAGRFRRAGAYAAGREACGLAAADVNGDGLVDLLSAHARHKHLTVLLGRGAGAFRVAHRYRGGRACDLTASDLNSDGKLDVVLADSEHNAVTARLGGGDGTFGGAARYTSGSTFGVAVADLNHDGRPDIATANCCPDASVSVLLGAANGSFGPAIRYPMGHEYEDYVDTVLVADYDRDGHLDIATPGRPSVRRGRGDGTFEHRGRAFGGSAYTQAGAVADFNGDGWPDLAFSEACNELEVDCDRYPARSIAVFLNWSGQPVPPCVVPPLVGERSSGATERQLARAGCRIGHVSHRHSSKARKGTVIAQRPRPGAVRPANSPVNLVVSRGRRR